LTVEALTGGLAGHGRADPPEGWGATVFLQILDPQAFGGLAAFQRQMDQVSMLCHSARPSKPGADVRLPGERGLRHKALATAKGLALHPSIMPMLQTWADGWQVAVPAPLD
jgi:L-lactate dehydrogenase